MCIIQVTVVLGDLCDNIGLVGVSAKWSYVTASCSHHDQLSHPYLVSFALIFMHVGHPYIPLFKIARIFDLLVHMSGLSGLQKFQTTTGSELVHVHVD